jgi:hypothetical protein
MMIGFVTGAVGPFSNGPRDTVTIKFDVSATQRSYQRRRPLQEVTFGQPDREAGGGGGMSGLRIG